MADATHIEWTDATWNVINGCAVVSPGCTNCYAMKMAHRLEAMGVTVYRGLTTKTKAGAVWNGKVRVVEDALTLPLRWKKPRRIFVNSMSDLFHPDVPDAAIDQVFAVMALAPQHTFQILTKRPERMRAYLEDRGVAKRIGAIMETMADDDHVGWFAPACDGKVGWIEAAMPLPNVWLGVSVEDQARADERIPLLLDTPAAVRWISAEPLLGPVDLGLTLKTIYRGHATTRKTGLPGNALEVIQPALDWVVAGGESGPGARPMHPDWARSLRDQCAAAGVPFLFKQWGDWAAHEDFEAGSWRAGATLRVVPALGREGGAIACAALMERVGKRAAGRLLDGQLHDAYPEVPRG